MDDRELQAIYDYLVTTGWDAAEALQDALDNLRRELLGED